MIIILAKRLTFVNPFFSSFSGVTTTFIIP
ncbi:hypothetical protein ACQ27_gp376 [Klebsiella phage K64-1]|nr:hypothetical protein ACQ27_gp376 [Klebsiella phage K64-1]